MSGFGKNPTTGTQGSLPANQFPLSSVAVPGTANADLTALEGGPISTDSNGNPTAPASMYVKDGGDVTQGAKADTAITDSTTTNTKMSFLKGLVKILADIWDSTNHRIHVDGSGVTQPVLDTNSASSNTHLSNIDTATSDLVADLDTLITNTGHIPSSPAQEGGNLATLVANTADLLADGDHLATIDTSTAASKTDLDSILTHEAAIDTATAAMKTDLDGIKTDADHLPTIDTSTATSATKLTSILTALQGILQVEQADLSATGTISAAQATEGTPVSNATVQLAVGEGQSSWKAQFLAGTGGFTSATTIVADGSPDGGTTWYAKSFKVSGATTPATSVVGPGPIELSGNASGLTHVRIRCSVLNSTETINVTLRGSAGIGDIGILSPLPAGQNLVGGVNVVDSAGANKLGVDSSGRITEVNSASINTHLANIDTDSASLVTNTTGLATQATLASVKTDLDTLVTNTADLLADGDNLATINTNTANIPAKGAAVTSASTPVNIASDQVVPVKRSSVAVYTLASTTTSGSTQNSGDLTVGPYTEISIDINTTAQAGTNPTIQYFWERKGADGIYYVLWQSAVLTAATNTLSTSIGAGMAYNQSLGLTGRLRWVVGGTSTPTFTHSLNVYGK